MSLTDILLDLFRKKKDEQRQQEFSTPTPSVSPATLSLQDQSQIGPKVFHESEFSKAKKVVNNFTSDIKSKASDFTSNLVDKASPIVNKADNLVDNLAAGIHKAKTDWQNKPENQLSLGLAKKMQQFPDTTINLPDTQIPTETGLDRYIAGQDQLGNNILKFVSSMPGEIVRGYGKTLEDLSTKQGRQTLAQFPQRISKEGVSLQTINDPTVQAAFNVSDFLPFTAVGGIVTKKLAKEGTEKIVKEGVEKLAKEGTEKIAEKAGQTYLRGDIGIIEKQLDKLLGTDSFNFTGSWRTQLPARETAKKQLLDAVANGDQTATKTLEVVTDLEKKLENAQLLRQGKDIPTDNLPLVKQSDQAVGGTNPLGTSEAGTVVPSLNKAPMDPSSLPLAGREDPSGLMTSNLPSSRSTQNSLSSNRTNFLTRFSMISPSTDDYNTYFKEVQQQAPHFNSVLSDVASESNGQYLWRLKEQDSLDKKLFKKNQDPLKPRGLGSMDDTLAGTVLSDDLPKTLENAQKRGINITTDYRGNPTFLGYKGVHADMEMPNGMVGEVQFNTRDGLYRKEYAHTIYDKWRKYIENNGESRFEEVYAKIPENQKVEFIRDVEKSIDIYDGKIAVPQEYIDMVDGRVKTPGSADLNATSSVKIGAEPGIRPFSFPETVKVADNTTPEFKQLIEESQAANKLNYEVLPNKISIETAQKRINANPDEALEYAASIGNESAEKTATQLLLLGKYQREGSFKLANDLLEFMSDEAKTRGQAIQILSAYSRLTPEGALKFAQRQVNKVNADLPVKKKIKITEKQTERITKKATELGKMKPGKDRDIKAGELMKEIAEVVPPTLAQKISSLQTIMQLLNPKTMIRNLGGNLGFGAIETAKDVVATPLDWVTSKFTGQRTKGLPSLKTQLQGGVEGFKAGVTDAIKGIDTSNTAGSQFELPKTHTFKDPILGSAEIALDVALKAPDRAFYTAAYNDSLRAQMVANKLIPNVDKPTEAMIKNAHLDGLYRTFQDESVASKMFSGIKKALNIVGIGKKGNRWGFGDLILKYPKTPGNILSRALDYSPVGFGKAVIELARPIVKGEFNQKQFVESTARALVGLPALIGTGAALHRLGIISGKKSGDKDVNALENERGFGQYKLNVSALGRLALSGFKPEAIKEQEGDRIISYDWFQPQAINLAMGADIDANKGDAVGLVGNAINGLASASDTLVEQPLIKGISNLFSSRSLPEGVMKAAAGAPASFIPTLLNQIRQLTDNTSRNTWDPNLGTQSLNQVKGKIPGLASTLPPYVNTRGENSQVYQDGGNNIFNVFLNPAFVSKLKDDPVTKEVLRIYNASGETQQMPRQVGTSIDITQNGESKSIKLTGQQQADLQRYVGQNTQRMLDEIFANPKYQNMKEDKKAQVIANVMSDIMTAGKIQLLGHHPKNVDVNIRKILEANGFKKNQSSINDLPLVPQRKPLADAMANFNSLPLV